MTEAQLTGSSLPEEQWVLELFPRMAEAVWLGEGQWR